MKFNFLNTIIILVILLFGIFTLKSEVYASFDAGTGATGSGNTGNASSFNPDSWKPSSTTDASGASRLESMGNTIVGLIQVVGSIISVAVLAIIGIKYMTGSVEEKAEYKKSLLPYFIGAVILFGASTIAGIIYNIAINL